MCPHYADDFPHSLLSLCPISIHPSSQLEGIDGHKPIPWHFYYAALPHLFSAFPHAEGLLWSNDDVVINYWNLASANKVGVSA